MFNYQPAFLLGNPRSGTSLFRIILHNHKAIVSPPECGFSQWWYDKYHDWVPVNVYENRLSTFLEDLHSSKKIETWELDFAKLRKFIIQSQPLNYSDLVACVFRFYDVTKKDAEVLVDKNNYYVRHLELLPLIWPAAKFVHLIRDGRDVACSYFEVNALKTDSEYKPKLATSIGQVAQEWKGNNLKIKHFIDERPGSSITVRYEDLILDTPKTLSSITSFFGLDYDENSLNYYLNSKGRGGEPEKTLDWKMKTREKPDQSKVGRYRADLSKNQLAEFNTIAGDLLKIYGYYE